ncbi:MAG: glycosyltransferase family protein [Planctomycetota bacterium]
MKLAILHYHLNRGGVTQVILNQLRALEIVAEQLGLSEVLVLHGGRTEAWPDDFELQSLRLNLASISGLDYATDGQLRESELANAIAEPLDTFEFRPEETVLQIHNHSLGKNASLPGATRELSQRGFRILLQIHDFAEDLRPTNFANYTAALRTNDAAVVGRHVYPTAPHIHYAVLNARDRSLLIDAGACEQQVHCLPNPVAASGATPSHPNSLAQFRRLHGLSNSDRLVLYPVRGIRRKNVGELLLWSAALPDRRVYALTLPATSDDERPSFERWRALATELNLPVLFDVGLADELSFQQNVAAASHIITTSVAEGFGLVFLEAWLHGRPLIGRNLPEITGDFADRGLNLSHLRESVQIPAEWIDTERFINDVSRLHASVCADYGTPVLDSMTPLQKTLDSGTIDFARLTTSEQVSVIRRVATDRSCIPAFVERNPWMQESLGDDMHWGDLLEANATAVRSGFSLQNSAHDLLNVFRQMLNSPVVASSQSLPAPERILDAFLSIDHFLPIRVEQ